MKLRREWLFQMKKTKTIRVQKVIPGYKIAPEYKGEQLVAIKVQWTDIYNRSFELNEPVRIEIGNEYMIIPDWRKEVIDMSNPFKDKFGRELISYILGYFYWKPTMMPVQEGLFA